LRQVRNQLTIDENCRKGLSSRCPRKRFIPITTRCGDVRLRETILEDSSRPTKATIQPWNSCSVCHPFFTGKRGLVDTGRARRALPTEICQGRLKRRRPKAASCEVACFAYGLKGLRCGGGLFYVALWENDLMIAGRFEHLQNRARDFRQGDESLVRGGVYVLNEDVVRFKYSTALLSIQRGDFL